MLARDLTELRNEPAIFVHTKDDLGDVIKALRRITRLRRILYKSGVPFCHLRDQFLSRVSGVGIRIDDLKLCEPRLSVAIEEYMDKTIGWQPPTDEEEQWPAVEHPEIHKLNYSGMSYLNEDE